jgi:cell division protein ZapA (FtsZ GTPase activity inhibitor)
MGGKRQLRIEALGTSFSIQSGDDEELLQRVSHHLTDKIREIQEHYAFADPLKIALLAGLNITAEYFKEKENKKTDESVEIQKIADRLITVLDETLKDDTDPT